MKKTLTILGLFGLIIVQAQVGINTDSPKATLDVKKNPNLEKTIPQGFILPKLTTAERSNFTNVEKGTMVYNTDKECLEVYTITQSGAYWDCMPSTTSASAQNIAVTPAGFDGAYIPNVTLTTANKVKFKLKNNSFSTINNVDFSKAVNVINMNNHRSVSLLLGENSAITLTPGDSTVLSYTLVGTPRAGTLTAKFDKLGLQADQSTQVSLGTATIADKIAYVVSLTTGGTTIQGKINNGAEQLTIEIPYTQGQGSYNAFTSDLTAAEPGHNGDNNGLTLNIPAGNFGLDGKLTATITVGGGDTEYEVKQMAPGAEYTIATFPISMGGSNFNVVVKGIGGISDRNFGNGTHDFLYLPVEVTGTYNVNGQPYIKTWLNMNLGAEYAKVSSPNFNLFINKTGAATHSDTKTYGSLFQWQRKADGHEFRDSPTSSSLASSWTASGTWDGKFITVNSPTDINWVSGGISSTGSDLLLWHSNGVNNPCPVGYHIPTQTEWQDLHEALTGSRTSVNSLELWNQSILPNFAAAGLRHRMDGVLSTTENAGYYQAADKVVNSNVHSQNFYFNNFNGSYPESNYGIPYGQSVRCIKN